MAAWRLDDAEIDMAAETKAAAWRQFTGTGRRRYRR